MTSWRGGTHYLWLLYSVSVLKVVLIARLTDTGQRSTASVLAIGCGCAWFSKSPPPPPPPPPARFLSLAVLGSLWFLKSPPPPPPPAGVFFLSHSFFFLFFPGRSWHNWMQIGRATDRQTLGRDVGLVCIWRRLLSRGRGSCYQHRPFFFSECFKFRRRNSESASWQRSFRHIAQIIYRSFST